MYLFNTLYIYIYIYNIMNKTIYYIDIIYL